MKAPLVAAASHGHVTVVKLFKELGIDGWERRQSLLEAVQNGHLPVVAELLVTPRDLSYEKPDGSGIGYLGSAAQNGHLDIVIFLLSKGASQFSLKPRWTSPLHQAAEEGHTAVARALVKHNAASLTARNTDGCTPLLVACFRNKAGVAEYLASKMEKDDLDIRADNRFSALFWAVRNDNVRLVHKLL
ncbi:ankyrin, partial [Hyaloscypha variabilis F]